jgi:hypothetical protein
MFAANQYVMDEGLVVRLNEEKRAAANRDSRKRLLVAIIASATPKPSLW